MVSIQIANEEEATIFCRLASQSDFWPGHFAAHLERLPDFFKKVLVSRTGCWLWCGYVTPEGYGHFSIGRRTVFAHRFIVEATRGPIAASLVVDHLCRTRHCVNPAHLEVTTHEVNLLRGETSNARGAIAVICLHGHPFSPENTYRRPGSRGKGCRICRRDARRRCDARRAKET